MRRWIPEGIFPRLVLLLAVVLMTTLASALVTLRLVSLQPGSEQIADLLAAQIVVLRALQRTAPQGTQPGQGTVALDVRHRDVPPPQAETPSFPFLQRIETRLIQRLGAGTEIRVESGVESRLWVATPGTSPAWVGVAIPPFAQQATRLTAIVLCVAATLVLLAAAWFARSLTRPIERLARNASRLASGTAPTFDVGANAPREVRSLAQALVDAGRERQRLDAERALMLAGISHDLRTPLARLQLALALEASDPALRAGMREDLAEIDAMLAQFIDFARGHGDESPQPVEVTSLLHEALSHERADPGQWTLRGADTECRRTLRPQIVRRALANLIRNALRYGRAPFELQLECDADELRLRVVDRGPGVNPDRISHLAQPFVRGDPARGGAGSGLGLAVVAQAALAHSGALHLANRDGGGFIAELRLRAPGG